jgi:RNA polymerase primary sigma factor
MARKYSIFGLPMEDLMSEGSLGLVQAARRFDPQRGTRFMTYAVWSVKRAMIKALVEQRGVVSLPYHKSSLLFSVKRAAKELSQQRGSKVSSYEIACEVGVTETQVEEISHAADGYVSLDAPIDYEDSDDLYALCQNRLADDPFDLMNRKEDRWRLKEALRQLPNREQAILRMRYGLDGQEELTLVEIGQKLGLSRQRVQQLEVRAIHRLQNWLGVN